MTLLESPSPSDACLPSQISISESAHARGAVSDDAELNALLQPEVPLRLGAKGKTRTYPSDQKIPCILSEAPLLVFPAPQADGDVKVAGQSLLLQ